jgi:hypothetical protein
MLAETANGLLAGLERDGIAVLPQSVAGEELRAMQSAFEARLQHVRWNDTDGYEKERFRQQLEDVLTLDQGFVDAALHPIPRLRTRCTNIWATGIN